MILSDLLGARVHADSVVGRVIDVRLALDAPAGVTGTTARLHGLVVSPHARSSTLGYERVGVRSPWLVAALVRWRHRGVFLVPWEDVARLAPGRVDLRPGFRRADASLPADPADGSGRARAGVPTAP